MIVPLLLLGLQAFAQPVPGQPHAQCLKSVAAALEASGEGLGDVASATVTACIPAEAGGRTEAFERLSPKTQNELIRSEREQRRAEVVLMLVRLRACRRTVGCDVNALP
jgi:hypothetical protein